MKKVLLSCFMVAFVASGISSCSGTTETKTEKTVSETTVTTTEPTVVTPPKADDVPVFSSAEVNKNLALFQPLKEQYLKALESRDPAQISDFMKKYTAWATASASWASKLKPEEQQAFGDYLTRLNQEWQEATLKVAGH